jgi:hypothetical protein
LYACKETEILICVIYCTDIIPSLHIEAIKILLSSELSHAIQHTDHVLGIFTTSIVKHIQDTLSLCASEQLSICTLYKTDISHSVA